MSAPTDDMFQDAHSVFTRNHADQREALLASLPSKPPAKRNPRFRKILAGLAAALLIGLAITAFFTTRTAPAYGLDGLRERLLLLRSLYMKGWLFQQKKTDSGVTTVRFPVQQYFERPGRYYTDSYGFSTDESNFLTGVTNSSTASDGDHAMIISHDQKMAITAPGDRVEAQLFVENHLQYIEVDEIIGGHAADFERAGFEQLGDEPCDIYQSKISRRPGELSRRIWINRTNGLPVRVMIAKHAADGTEQPQCEFAEIRADIDPPPELFSFKAPAGYALTEIKEKPKTQNIIPISSSSWHNQEAGVWIALKIDDRAILLCWSHSKQEKGKKIWFPITPQFALRGGAANRECSERKLYETVSGDTRWRWSLLLPNDGQPIGFDTIAVGFPPPKDKPRLGLQPLVFPQDRLAEILEDLQRRTLEMDGNFSAIKSLGQLREIIANSLKSHVQ